ncbi:MAG: hypothetical protein KDK74_10140 [Cephaloticoccus sp.]|nr:hypothetical protein [Cephaloticoccus sp.]
MTRPSVIAALIALSLAGTACNTPPSSATNDRLAAPEAFDNQVARQAYVDNQYDKFLKGGRAPDENAARAMAGLEWDTYARRRAQSDNDSRVRWSSDTRAKIEQRTFEEELREMGY